MTSADTALHDEVESPASSTPWPRPWLGLFAILPAMLMNLLDSTVINVAAPSILGDIGGTYTSIQWMAASYTLALAVGLLTGGRLGDIFGRRRMLLFGVVGFMIASVACAVAWSPGSLIGARVIQGLFGAVMIPQGFGLIRDLFPPKDIGKAFGVFGPAIGLSTILGPVVAGGLIDLDIFNTSWRMIFFINVPLGILALILGVKGLPNAAIRRDLKLDIPGAVIAGIGMFMLVFPLVQGQELDWPAWIFVVLAGSVVVLGLFVALQWRQRQGGRTRLVELGVFAKRSYSSGVLFVLMFFGTLVGFGLTIGMFLQIGLGYTPVKASLVMTSWAIGAFIGSGTSAGLMKLGRRILFAGLVVMGIGMAATYLVLRAVEATLSPWSLVLPLFLFGLGMGSIFVPLFDIIIGDVANDEVGSAAGMLEALQQLGASLGVAVLGTIFFRLMGDPPTFGKAIDATETITVISVALTIVTLGLVFLLPKKARESH